MDVKPEDRLKINDYVILKEFSTIIFKVIFINHIEDKLSLKVIFPTNLVEPYQVVSVKKSKTGTTVLRAEEVKILYE